MPIVDVSNLTYRYGGVAALHDLSFTVPQGALYALLGPNGSGKTTLLQVLMGLRRARSGRVSVMDRDSSRLTFRDRASMAYIAEGQSLPKWMRIEQLEAYLAPLYPTWDAALARDLRERFGLDPRRTIRTLSRGEQMKAALLCALAPRPRLLLMDEPFTGMDALVKDDLVRGLLESAGTEGWTVILSSHDIPELEVLADWVGFLDDGRMLISEPMETLRARFKQVEIAMADESAASKAEAPADARRLATDLPGLARDRRSQPPACGALSRSGAHRCTRGITSRCIHRTRKAIAATDQRRSRVMTVLRQVAHVMMKDLRKMRWPMAGYGVLVALTTAHAVGGTTLSGGMLDALMFPLVLFGLFLTVSLVQGDSPTQADALWATWPIAPSAVLGAKIAFVVIFLVAPALIGQVAALYAIGVTREELPAMLWLSACAYGFVLFVAMIVASITRRLPTAMMAFVGTFVLLLMILPQVYLRISWQWQLPSVVGPIVGTGAGLAFLLLLYRTRDVHRFASFAGAGCVLAVLFAPTKPSGAVTADGPPGMPRGTLVLELAGPADRAGADGLQLRAHVEGAPDSVRVTLVHAVALIHLRSGATLRIPAVNEGIELRTPPLPDASRFSWPGAHDKQPDEGLIVLNMDGAQRTAVSGGVANVQIEGRVRVTAPRVAAIMPLQANVARTVRTKHVLITKWTHGFGDATLDLATSSIPPDAEVAPGAAFVISGNAPEYAIVNETQGQALVIYPQTSGGHSAFLVLPGPMVQQRTAQYEIKPSTNGRPSDHLDAWFSTARLMIIDWAPVGSYPVHATWVAP